MRILIFFVVIIFKNEKCKKIKIAFKYTELIFFILVQLALITKILLKLMH